MEGSVTNREISKKDSIHQGEDRLPVLYTPVNSFGTYNVFISISGVDTFQIFRDRNLSVKRTVRTYSPYKTKSSFGRNQILFSFR